MFVYTAVGMKEGMRGNIERAEGAFPSMIVGFGLLCCVTVACFFPHELMPGASSGSFISFNIGIGVASTLSAIAYALVVSGKADGSAIPAMAFVGYGTLVAGILLSGLSASDIDASVAPVAGVLCGLGLSFTMLFWFGLLTFLSDRRAAFTQGWQALIGELLFIALALLPLPYFKYALLLLCAVSGALGIFAYRVIARTYDQPYPAERFELAIACLPTARICCVRCCFLLAGSCSLLCCMAWWKQ